MERDIERERERERERMSERDMERARRMIMMNACMLCKDRPSKRMRACFNMKNR